MKVQRKVEISQVHPSSPPQHPLLDPDTKQAFNELWFTNEATTWKTYFWEADFIPIQHFFHQRLPNTPTANTQMLFCHLALSVSFLRSMFQIRESFTCKSHNLPYNTIYIWANFKKNFSTIEREWGVWVAGPQVKCSVNKPVPFHIDSTEHESEADICVTILMLPW